MFLSVRSIESSLPTITFPKCSNKMKSSSLCVSNELFAEDVVDEITQEKDVSINYQLFGFPSSYPNVQVCADVLNVKSNFQLLELTCLPQDKNVLNLHNLRVGRYEISLVLSAYNNEEILFEASKRTIILELRHPVEFLPTYDWQPLHIWHTVPNGVETR